MIEILGGQTPNVWRLTIMLEGIVIWGNGPAGIVSPTFAGV
jgi:hypothetical protein